MDNGRQMEDRGCYRLTPNDIAEGVVFFRKQAGWKQFALAAEAGVNERTVQRIERGEKVSGESLRRVASALHLEENVFLKPVPLPTVEEREKAEREVAELTQIEARGLTTLSHCETALTAHILCFVDHLVSENLADSLAEFKDSLRDWSDVWSDLAYVDRLEASRSLLAMSERLETAGYATHYGVYTTEDRWRFRVAVLVFVPVRDGRTPSATQLILPRTLQTLERRGPVAMRLLP